MRLLPFAAGTLVAAALAAAAPAHAAHTRDWTKTWTVGDAPTVRIVTDEARVRIHRGAPGAVRARVHYEVRSWGFTTGPRDPKVTLAQEGGAIRIEAREALGVVFIGGMDCRFEIDVTVPPTCDLSARTSDGAITCGPLAGRVSLESGDGRITASGLAGTVVLWSGDGAIEADSLEGSLLARSGDGHMTVRGRFEHLDLSSGDGSIDATAVPGSRAATAWSLRSGDGSIVLRIPRDLRVLLDASSRDGSLRVDLPVATKGLIRDHALQGELNGGQVPLRLRSGDGSIRLALAE